MTEPAESQIIGNYVLRSLIGRGAMSDVYAAEHRTLGTMVALKLLHSDDAGFEAEAAQTRAIRHPNVVRVLDFGRDGASGGCYLVMERVDGEDLATRLGRLTRLDEAPARTLFAAIADGMHAAHACGIVHRDLKPANVMLSGDEPKIVDFGIAKDLGGESAVSTGRRIGTPAYMAPEQLTGGLVAPCVDVWAFGVILFEALTGRLPFGGFADGRCPQLFETAPRAGTLIALSPALDRLISRCLDKDPGRRPASMAEIARELRAEDIIEPERITQDVGAAPTIKAPTPRTGRSPRARTGRTWIAVVGVALLAALAIGGIASLRSSETTAASTMLAATPAIATPANPPVAVIAPVPVPVVAQPLEIEVRSAPAGAQIIIDGKSHGVTPARLALAGPTSIVVRRAGYVPSRVRADHAGAIDVRLVPLPRTGGEHGKRETLD